MVVHHLAQDHPWPRVQVVPGAVVAVVHLGCVWESHWAPAWVVPRKERGAGSPPGHSQVVFQVADLASGWEAVPDHEGHGGPCAWDGCCRIPGGASWLLLVVFVAIDQCSYCIHFPFFFVVVPVICQVFNLLLETSALPLFCLFSFLGYFSIICFDM